MSPFKVQRLNKLYSGRYADDNGNTNGHKCHIQIQYTIYRVGHARESYPAVPRCGLKSIDPTQVPPGLTHAATGAILIAPEPDESISCRRCICSIIGHYNHSETNHNQHGVRIKHPIKLYYPHWHPGAAPALRPHAYYKRNFITNTQVQHVNTFDQMAG